MLVHDVSNKEQVDALFLQSMLKTKRMEQHFIDKTSPNKEVNSASFQELLDDQPVKFSDGINRLDFPKPNTVTQDPILLNKSKPHYNFIQSIWPIAEQAAALIGLDPKLLIAEAVLETGWGKYIAKNTEGVTSNNVFNMKTGSSKAFDGVQIKTTEYIDHHALKTTESFRKYDSVEQSFYDYVSLIQNDARYKMALAHTHNPERYLAELSKAGYATDPDYSSKVLSIYYSEGLKLI